MMTTGKRLREFGVARLVSLFTAVLYTILALSNCASAQSVGFVGAESSIYSVDSNTHSLSSMAVDNGGNSYLVNTDSSSGTNQLLKVSSSGSVTVLNSNFSISPSAIAVKPDGSILYFIYSSSICTYGWGIAKSATSGNTNAVLLPCGDLYTVNAGTSSQWTEHYVDPTDLKVDSLGNVYIADYGGGMIYKIVAGDQVPTQWISLAMPASSGGYVYVGQPSNIAVSQSGSKVYVTYGRYSSSDGSFVSGCVGSLPVSAFGTSFNGTTVTNINCNLSSIGTGLNADSSGNVYASGYTTSGSTSSYYVFEVSSSAVTPMTPPTASAIYGFGLDSAGSIYVRANSAAQANILTGSFGAINLGSANVGSTSAAQPLSFVFSSSGQLGSINVYTLGVTGSTFGLGAPTTCSATVSYQTGDSCTVYVTMSPSDTTLQRGAVVLKSTAGVPLATVYVYGTGMGSHAVLWPATRSTSITALNSPAGVAVDANGNLFVTDGSSLYNETPSGSGFVKTLISSNLSGASGVVIDGAGSIYVADKGNKRVVKFVPSGTSYTQSTLGSSLVGPVGVAVDGAGNLYVADGTYIYKETLTNGSYAQSTVLSSLSSAAGVCVDSGGNVYATDVNGDSVLKATLSNGSYAQSTITSSLNSPSGIVVDGAGNLYVAEKGGGRISVLTFQAGSYSPEILTDNGSETLSGPVAVAFDGVGNLYVVELGKQQVTKEDFSTSPTVTFLPAKSDTDSETATTITVINTGNSNVTFTAPSSGTNPFVGADFRLGNASCGMLSNSSSSYVLESGTSCSYPVMFHPSLSAAIGPTLEDFDLVTDGSTLVAALAGTVMSPVSISPAAGALTSGTYLTPYSLTFSATGETGPYQYQVDSLPGGLSLSSDGVFSGTPTQTGSFSFSITVTDSIGSTVSQSYSLQILQSSQSALSVTGVPIVAQAYGATFTVGSSGGSGTGAVTLSGSGACSVSGTTVTMTSGTGSCTVTANKAADGNYLIATGTATVNATLASQSGLSVTGVPSLAQAYGATFTVGSSGGSGTGVVTLSGSGACSVSGTAVTMTSGTGSCTVTASKAADNNYLIAMGTATVSATLASQSGMSVTGVPSLAQAYGATFTVGSSGGSGTGAVTLSGSGACSVSGTTVTMTSGTGTCTVTSSKAADGNYATATSSAAIVSATLASQNIHYTGAVSATYGDAPLVLTTTAGGSGNAVIFTVKNGTGSVSGSTLTITGAGAVIVAANQPGDSNYAAATETTQTIEVAPARLTVTVSDVKIAYGSSLPSLSGSLAGVVPGDVITATYSTTATASSQGGAYSITAALLDPNNRLANYSVTNNSGVLTITAAPTTTSVLTFSPHLIYYGDSVTLSANVTGPLAAPTGHLTFHDGSVALGTVGLNAGLATLTLDSLAVGSHTLTADYSGDLNYTAATSTAGSLTVQPAALTINPGSQSPVSVLVHHGGSASSSFTVGKNGVLSGVVNLSCSGLPAGLSCVLSSSTIDANKLPVAVSITVNSTGVRIIGAKRSLHSWMLMTCLLGSVLSFGVRRRRAALMVLAGGLLFVFALIGCGSGSGPAATNSGSVTPVGTYSGTITAANAGAATQVADFTVVVAE